MREQVLFGVVGSHLVIMRVASVLDKAGVAEGGVERWKETEPLVIEDLEKQSLVI